MFRNYIDRVLAHEGGYVNNPKDPGGETQWGISKKAYPHLDIRALTREDAIKIYEQDYWFKTRAHTLPRAIAFQVFDAAVNHGNVRAVKWLQRALGLPEDGVCGPKTQQAAAQADQIDLVFEYLAVRAEFYTRAPAWPTFGRGWVNRTATNMRHAADDLR